ncbi:MAG: hypothetical protein J6U23_10730 [Clostridiales bacterium]|nr:hypothetical protein [Clostridiales bacterium]
MSEVGYSRQVNESDIVNRIVRAVVLIVVALILAVVSVSFAVHHMRLKFEEEYKGITDSKMRTVSDVVQKTVSGDELIGDTQAAITKYNNIFPLLLADTSTDSYSKEDYALFLYTGGQLSLLTASDDTASFAVVDTPISDWLSADNSTSTVYGDNSQSILVPVADSTGKCVAVFEYKCSFGELSRLGNEVENRILKAVIVSCAAGVVLFLIQLFIPKLIMRSGRKGGQTL